MEDRGERGGGGGERNEGRGGGGEEGEGREVMEEGEGDENTLLCETLWIVLLLLQLSL